MSLIPALSFFDLKLLNVRRSEYHDQWYQDWCARKIPDDFHGVAEYTSRKAMRTRKRLVFMANTSTVHRYRRLGMPRPKGMTTRVTLASLRSCNSTR